MGTHKALEIPLISTICRSLQRVIQRNIHFIGFLAAIFGIAPGNFAAKISHSGGQSIHFLIAEQTFHRAQTYTVMRGDKVKISRPVLRRWHTHQPALQVQTIASYQGINQQGWQREVIDTMGFVCVAKIGKILGIRDIGFGNDHCVGVDVFNHSAQQANDFVGLR